MQIVFSYDYALPLVVWPKRVKLLQCSGRHASMLGSPKRLHMTRLLKDFSSREWVTPSHRKTSHSLLPILIWKKNSPGARRHWLFTSALKNYRRERTLVSATAAGTGAGAIGIQSRFPGTTVPKVEFPYLPRRMKTKTDRRPRSDHK